MYNNIVFAETLFQNYYLRNSIRYYYSIKYNPHSLVWVTTRLLYVLWER